MVERMEKRTKMFETKNIPKPLNKKGWEYHRHYYLTRNHKVFVIKKICKTRFSTYYYEYIFPLL